MSASPEAAPAQAQPAPPRRRWRRLLILVAAAKLLVVFHAPLLRSVAGVLIVDDPPTRADAAVFWGEYGPFVQLPLDQVGNLYRGGQVKQVVLIEDRSSRLARLEIVPSLEPTVRREMAKRGVPEQALTVRTVNTHGAWDRHRQLVDWLHEHPDSTATALVDEFDTCRDARVFRQLAGPDELLRVRWRAVPDRRFGPTDWWHSRQGILRVTNGYANLGFVLLHGEETRPEPWDPDQYEQSLRESAGQ